MLLRTRLSGGGLADDGKRWSRWTLHLCPLGIYKRGGAGGEGTQIASRRVPVGFFFGIIVFRAGLFFLWSFL